MKAKKVITGAVAGLSFLALAATGAFANFHCEEGTVVAAGSGYAYPYAGKTPNPTIAAGQRNVTLTCSTPAGFLPVEQRVFLIKSTPDKDGVYAAALTALVEGSPVEYWISSKEESIRKSSTSYQRSYINVLNVKKAAN